MTRRREIMIALLEAVDLEPAVGETCEAMGARILGAVEELRERASVAREAEHERDQEHEEQRRAQARESASVAQLVASVEGPSRVDPSQVPPPKRPRRKRRHEGQAGLGL